MKKEVEQKELELFLQGEFVIEDEIKEDASLVPDKKPEELLAAAAAPQSAVSNFDNYN